MFNQKEKGGFIWLQKYVSYFKTFDILFTKKSCALKIAIPEFQKILDLLFLQDSIFSTFFLSDSSFTLFFHMYFSRILLTFYKHLFKGTPLNGCFRLFQ